MYAKNCNKRNIILKLAQHDAERNIKKYIKKFYKKLDVFYVTLKKLYFNE